MFCQFCGAQVNPGQQVCTGCSRPLMGYEFQRSRLERHVHLLGVFWIVYSVFILLGGAVVMVLSRTLFGAYGRAQLGMPPFLGPLLTVVACFLVLKAGLGILAGYGLVQRETWARILTIVLGMLSLLHVPFGTALGIYTIWVLMSQGADREYDGLARA